MSDAGIVMYCKNCGWSVMGATQPMCPDCRSRLNFVSWKDGEKDMAMSILANSGAKIDGPDFVSKNPFPRWDPEWVERQRS